MSRTAARKQFTMSDMDQAMRGIEFRRSLVLLDEIPGAYKDIDEVMEHAKDLVEIKHVLKQFVNVKGD
jgi:tRNA-splicing ligase RtcB